MLRSALITAAQAVLGAVLIGVLGWADTLDPIVLVGVALSVGGASVFLAFAQAIPAAPKPPARDDLFIEQWREWYVDGTITLDEFESQVARLLEHGVDALAYGRPAIYRSDPIRIAATQVKESTTAMLAYGVTSEQAMEGAMVFARLVGTWAPGNWEARGGYEAPRLRVEPERR